MSTWGGLAHTTEYYEVTVPYTAVLEHRPVFGCSGKFVPLSMSLSLLRLFLWRRIFILMDKPLPAQGNPNL